MTSFANVDVASINSAGILAFESSGFIENLKNDISSSNTDVANAALETVKVLTEGVDQWIEPYLVGCLPGILECLAVPKTKDAANHAGIAILAKSNGHSIRIVTSLLYESFKSMKWQTKKGALVLLGLLATYHPVVVTRNLPEMILELIGIAADVKKEVKDQVKVTFTQLCSTITNVDIIPIIPAVIEGYTDPVKKTEKALDALISTTFINDVDLPTLGLLVPILTKGMREKKVAVKRRAALVIGNMCKLVNDPRTAAAFYPILKPVLERGIDEIAVEEVRKVCQDSLDTLQRVSAEAQILSDAVCTDEQLRAAVLESVAANGVQDPTKFNIVIDFICKAMHFLVLGDNRDVEDWNQCLLPYLKSIVAGDVVEKVAREIYEKGIVGLSAEKADPEDEEEDLCNATFSLAYGTRVLLHQTPFRVKIGRKYGLVGPNGAGKSTLMKSIAGGNLAGFPTELITVYVECEIIGEKAEMSVIEYIMSDAKIQACNVTREEVVAMLTDMGFGVSRTAAALDAGVGTLSGGWRMKLALSRAMLLKPDMLLLDEPTNHLDQFAVKWLTEYIQNLKTCTCLLVSHDTKFLDAVR
jgi:elongation factor 3